MVATSATRDADNRTEFVAGVREVLGVDPEVISGDDEAALSFDGATRELTVGRRTSSLTSVAGRPSSCSGPTLSTHWSRSTSAACG